MALLCISSARFQSFSSRGSSGEAFGCGVLLSPFVIMTELLSDKKREIALEKVFDSFMLLDLSRGIVVLGEFLNVRQDSHVNAMNGQ